MRKETKRISVQMLLLAGCFILGGCATLTVTPSQSVQSKVAKQPVSIGVIVVGERSREALNDSQESAVHATSGKLFNKVLLLPDDARSKTAAEIHAAFGTEYILSSMITDISTDGRLNPLWFASIPLLFFKPYAPIVTFQAVINLEGTVRDARTGAVVFKKDVSSLVTDHFSPIEPQDKIRKMIRRGINNAYIDLLEETQQKLAGNK
jgi:hypothetical protein